MKIIVIGASGFVGSRACQYLQRSGHEVIRVVHRADGQADSGESFVVDVSVPSSFRALDHIEIENVDAVVNCAGLAHRFGRTSKIDFRRINVDGVRNVAEFAARNSIRRFVQLSSVLVYGTPHSAAPITEDHAAAPSDEYSSSKLAGEEAATLICSKFGIDLVILRPAPIIGEGSRGNVARLVRAIDSNRFVWIGDGRNRRSFVYVEDVARAVEASLHIDRRHSIFNVVGGEISIAGLVETIADQLEKTPFGLRIPSGLAKLALTVTRPVSAIQVVDRYRRTLETWLADAVYSGEAFSKLGFTAETGIEEGLRAEIDSYIRHKQR